MTLNVALQLIDQQHAYRPGQSIRFEYDVESTEPESVAAVEASVLWHTEGKGDEDMGVHFFERWTAEAPSDVGKPIRVEVALPNTPLSYDGRILKIRWLVRVRAFPRRGRAVCQEAPFRLLKQRA